MSGYRRALITGASSGTGAAFARALPATTDLLLTRRDAERLRALSAALAGGTRQIRSVVADLATDAGREAVIAAAAAMEIDLLVNNAGIGRFGRVVDNPPSHEAEIVAVNVAAPVALTRALLPGMIERARADSGARAGIILVSSAVAFAPMPYFATYAASKGFLLHYAEALAAELADQPVDVLALCPGATATAFAERAGLARSGFAGSHSAERVARDGLAALGRRVVHVVGPTNAMAAIGPRLLPRRLVAGMLGRVLRNWR